MKQAINLLILALLLAGCSREHDPVAYAENDRNGLKKTITVGDVNYTILYKTPAYIARKEHLDKTAEAAREKQLQGMAWFNIAFSISGYNQSPLRYQVSGQEEYAARQNYYLNEAPNDIYLLYGSDTLYVSSYWFENSQNLLPFETIIVGFKLPGNVQQPEQDLKLSFYDRVFKNGIIKAVIKKEDLEDTPGL